MPSLYLCRDVFNNYCGANNRNNVSGKDNGSRLDWVLPRPRPALPLVCMGEVQLTGVAEPRACMMYWRRSRNTIRKRISILSFTRGSMIVHRSWTNVHEWSPDHVLDFLLLCASGHCFSTSMILSLTEGEGGGRVVKKSCWNLQALIVLKHM